MNITFVELDQDDEQDKVADLYQVNREGKQIGVVRHTNSTGKWEFLSLLKQDGTADRIPADIEAEVFDAFNARVL